MARKRKTAELRPITPGGLPLEAGEPGRSLALTYKGHEITADENRLIDVTAMWRAVGSPNGKDFREWKRNKEGASFIRDLASSLNVGITHIQKTTRGGGGGSWAHWQIALAYAKYLSNEFHRFVNHAFREWTEEKADPGLKVERAYAGYKARGHSDEWIARRLEGVCARNALTSAMKDHNCTLKGRDNPYAEATRSLSLSALGKTPREIKAAKGLPRAAATRDHLSTIELAALRFAEVAGTELIRSTAADGNAECVDCCRRAGKAVKLAVDSLKSTA